MSRYFRATIQENRPVHPVHNLLTLSTPADMPAPQPGQFFMIEVNKGTDPLLKRAFSLFKKTSEGIQILYRIQGRGTGILRNMKEGARVDTLGPLGNFYPAPQSDRIPLIVAGGIGIASVFPLIEKLSGRAVVFYGARTKNDLLYMDEVRVLTKELILSTDDGSEGQKGTAADMLRNYLTANAELAASSSIYACGPRPLLKAVSQYANEKRIRSYISMEEHMACGIGACLGCVVSTRDGYRRVCKEGPVFSGTEIVW